MNNPRHLSDSRRSPYPRRRKSLVPRSPDLARSLPAITLLAPDTYHLQQTMAPRPLSPGAFRMLPPRSARQKHMTSFVILNETIKTPVSSRPSTPSGRVSPFRGHGFKTTPTSSRTASRAPSPLPSPTRRKGVTLPTEKSKVVYKDIGLPPKSPKRGLKNTSLKEFKGTTNKPKPTIAAKPTGIKPKVKIANNTKSGVMSTVDTNKDKKSPEPPKISQTETSESQVIDKVPVGKEETGKQKIAGGEDSANVGEPAPETLSSTETYERGERKVEKVIPCYQPDKCCVVPPTMASPLQTATSTVAVPIPPSPTLTTMSRTPVTAATLSSLSATVTVTDAFNKAPFKPNPPDKAATPRLGSTEKLRVPGNSPSRIESAIATITTVDEVVRSRAGSAVSRKSASKLSLDSPTISDKTRSSMVTVRATSNGSLASADDRAGVSGAIMSAKKIIRADPDVEVLSPNNLMSSPPSSAMTQPLWHDDRIPNGDSSSSSAPKGRCRQFLSALYGIITYICCCCKRWSCCTSTRRWNCTPACCQRINCKKSKCCQKKAPAPAAQSTSPTPCCARCKECCKCNPCSLLKQCFSKINCCKKIQCCKGGSCCTKCTPCSSCCKKIKCCEGAKCCKKVVSTRENTKTSCCAKPTCSCKDCCAKMKSCCVSCGDGINGCCRSLFCLNLLCCQKCLRKCSCCHKYKCCQKGGCGSCCNPDVKRQQKARLDKKNSRASNQSKQERPKLDSALVDHSSLMKAAIPVLPPCLAWLCLVLNCGIPGSGTLLSGMLCLCFGKPRFSVNDNPQNRMSSLMINMVIGVGQAFTTIFCLVGWGWSIWWGVIMVKLARKQKRLRLVEKNTEGPSTMNHVDVERR